MFHKEGYTIITISFIIIALINLLSANYIDSELISKSIGLITIIVLILILQFFRNPKRKTELNDELIISPVDGKVVAIEKVHEKEYFKDERIQISIFMSPLNVHVTRYAASGSIKFSKYHPGKYLVAWHPKSSEKNERTTIVINTKVFGEILYRQIAGAVARRIVNYAKVGNDVVQGKDAGFIKFGSRVDLFLPLDAKIKVELNQIVKGGEDTIAKKII